MIRVRDFLFFFGGVVVQSFCVAASHRRRIGKVREGDKDRIHERRSSGSVCVRHVTHGSTQHTTGLGILLLLKAREEKDNE
jgi:hypothetical protein